MQPPARPCARTCGQSGREPAAGIAPERLGLHRRDRADHQVIVGLGRSKTETKVPQVIDVGSRHGTPGPASPATPGSVASAVVSGVIRASLNEVSTGPVYMTLVVCSILSRQLTRQPPRSQATGA